MTCIKECVKQSLSEFDAQRHFEFYCLEKSCKMVLLKYGECNCILSTTAASNLRRLFSFLTDRAN